MFQKSLYLTRNICFILFLYDVKFVKNILDVWGRGEGFPKFSECQTKGLGGGGLKIDAFVRRLLWMAP